MISHHLKNHYKSHSDRRPYECAECDQSFKSKYALRNHERRHAAATEQQGGANASSSTSPATLSLKPLKLEDFSPPATSTASQQLTPPPPALFASKKEDEVSSSQFMDDEAQFPKSSPALMSFEPPVSQQETVAQEMRDLSRCRLDSNRGIGESIFIKREHEKEDDEDGEMLLQQDASSCELSYNFPSSQRQNNLIQTEERTGGEQPFQRDRLQLQHANDSSQERVETGLVTENSTQNFENFLPLVHFASATDSVIEEVEDDLSQLPFDEMRSLVQGNSDFPQDQTVAVGSSSWQEHIPVSVVEKTAFFSERDLPDLRESDLAFLSSPVCEEVAEAEEGGELFVQMHTPETASIVSSTPRPVSLGVAWCVHDEYESVCEISTAAGAMGSAAQRAAVVAAAASPPQWLAVQESTAFAVEEGVEFEPQQHAAAIHVPIAVVATRRQATGRCSVTVEESAFVVESAAIASASAETERAAIAARHFCTLDEGRLQVATVTTLPPVFEEAATGGNDILVDVASCRREDISVEERCSVHMTQTSLCCE